MPTSVPYSQAASSSEALGEFCVRSLGVGHPMNWKMGASLSLVKAITLKLWNPTTNGSTFFTEE